MKLNVKIKKRHKCYHLLLFFMLLHFSFVKCLHNNLPLNSGHPNDCSRSNHTDILVELKFSSKTVKNGK